MKKKRIVLIDDSRFVVSLYRSKLQAEGYQIDAALDGEAGLALLGEERPDLVMLDLGLPRMTGLEVLTHIREQPHFEGLPVIIVSGAYSTTVVEAAWQAGATCVFSKATDTPNEVVGFIRKAFDTAGAPFVDQPRRELLAGS